MDSDSELEILRQQMGGAMPAVSVKSKVVRFVNKKERVLRRNPGRSIRWGYGKNWRWFTKIWNNETRTIKLQSRLEKCYWRRIRNSKTEMKRYNNKCSNW